MQKKFGVNIHNVGETTQFFGTQKQSNIGQFTYDFLKKMKTYNLGKLTFVEDSKTSRNMCEDLLGYSHKQAKY